MKHTNKLIEYVKSIVNINCDICTAPDEVKVTRCPECLYYIVTMAEKEIKENK